jgi:hypothetical protein
MAIIDLKTGVPAPWHSLQVAAYEKLDAITALDFDAETHTYFMNGQKVPSVTQILWDLGEISEFSTWNDFARDRGLAVHAACALLPDRLDWRSVDLRIIGYLESFMRWVERQKFGVFEQEQRGFNSDLVYAGTWDLRVPVSTCRSGTLYLKQDGSLPMFNSYYYGQEWPTFLSMVNVWHWKERHGQFRRNGNRNGE